LKVLLIGSGGREHAIAWKLSQSAKVNKIFCAPGNGGTKLEQKCENINTTDIDELLEFALKEKVDVTIVGPEGPLVEGIVDKFKAAGIAIFGPSKKAAALEGSKAYAKEFMKKYRVKTAAYEVFHSAEGALSYLESCFYPVVIKADGLASGKGVVICNSLQEGKACIECFMVEDSLKGAGKVIVIEEFLEGVEASILAITDGKTIKPFLSAKDHKTIFEDGKGPNTGGMGVISPNPYCTEEVLKEFEDKIMLSTLRGIKEEQMDYVGVVFFGIMITKKGVYLLEYNVRFGDPETQAVLPLLDSDFMELIQYALNKKLQQYEISWSCKHSCVVVAASGGYPGKFNTGYTIKGVCSTRGKVFAAGASCEGENLITSGGRVLAVNALGDSLEESIKKAYEDIGKIDFKNIYYRRDIGKL